MRVSLARYRSLAIGHSIPLFAVLLEMLWAYAWLVWLSTWKDPGWERPPLALGSAIFLIVAAEAISRFTLSRQWPLRRVRAVVLLTLVVLLLAVVRFSLGGGYNLWDLDWGKYALEHLSLLIGATVFSTYLIWRGISTGREDILFSDLYRKFLVGLVGLVALLVFWGIGTRGTEFQRALSSVGLYVVAYFALGLLGLGLVNLQSIRESMLRHEGASGLFGRRWLILLLGMVLVIVLVGFGVASIFSFHLAGQLLHYLGVGAHWLFIGFMYGIALPLGVIAAGMVYVFRFFAHLFGPGQKPAPSFSPPDLSDLQVENEGEPVWGMPPEAMLAIKWSLVALLVIAVLFLLGRTLAHRWRGEQEEDIEEVSESLWSWETFTGDLLSFLAGLFGWLRRRKPTPLVPASPPIAVVEGDEEIRLFTVREIYQGLLWEGRKAGFPRRQPETPYEYQGKIESRVPIGAPDLREITEAYVAERYGSMETPNERLRLLNRLWLRLRSLLRGGETPKAQD